MLLLLLLLPPPLLADGVAVRIGVVPLGSFVNDEFRTTGPPFGGFVADGAAIETPLALKTCSPGPLPALLLSFVRLSSLSTLSLSLLELCLLCFPCLLLCLLCPELFPSASGVFVPSGVSLSFFELLWWRLWWCLLLLWWRLWWWDFPEDLPSGVIGVVGVSGSSYFFLVDSRVVFGLALSWPALGISSRANAGGRKLDNFFVSKFKLN